MTHDDSTRNETEPETADEQERSDQGGTDGIDRRSFMQVSAASFAGLGGMSTVAERAEAQISGERVIVVARGPGEHSYEIECYEGSIWKTDYAGGNDAVANSTGYMKRVEGSVQDWNADSYEFTGELHRVTGDGSLSFHFPDGGFVEAASGMDRIVVGGEGGGYTHYSLAKAAGDIDPIEATTDESQDHDDTSDGTEQSHTADVIEGRIWEDGVDTYSVSPGEPLQYVQIDDGHATVSTYRKDGRLNDGPDGDASIVFFYMGDGRYTTFFQNFTNLSQALRGYDETILLKHDNQSNPVGAQAHRMADTVREPTRDNFERSIRELTMDGYTIDMYIMSHGDRSSFKMSTGTHGSEDWYDYGDIQRLRSAFVGDIPLRMVYQCNCWGSNLNDAWLELGADAAAGSRYVNFFPNQLPKFASEWRQGHSFHEALNNSDTASSRRAVKGFLIGDMARTQGGQWGPRTCTHFAVLNNNGRCAKNYFTDRWGHDDSEWHSVKINGWDFVKHASEQIGAGDLTISR